MRAYLVLGIAFLAATPAYGQANCSIDGHGCGVSISDVNAAVTAAIPSPCGTPAGDTLNGTSGSGATCMSRPDSARPTAVQAINTTLAADCTWSVVFARATVSSLPIVHAAVVLASGATQPIPCSPLSRSSTGASGKCFPGQTTALTTALVTGGVTINPTASTCTAGLPVMVNVREPTQ